MKTLISQENFNVNPVNWPTFPFEIMNRAMQQCSDETINGPK